MCRGFCSGGMGMGGGGGRTPGAGMGRWSGGMGGGGGCPRGRMRRRMGAIRAGAVCMYRVGVAWRVGDCMRSRAMHQFGAPGPIPATLLTRNPPMKSSRV